MVHGGTTLRFQATIWSKWHSEIGRSFWCDIKFRVELPRRARQRERRGRKGSLQARSLQVRGGVALKKNLDFQCATKQASNKMASPTETDLPRLKRRSWDSDWAGCLRTRKSKSGGLLSIAGTAMKSWSSTKGSVATVLRMVAENYVAL